MMTVAKKESEVGIRRKEHYIKRIHLKFSLCWLLNTASSCESSSELGCQSATSQFEQQKMSRHRGPFETCFYCNEKIWHTHTYEDDNKKPLLLFETFRENPNKSLISNTARQTSQVTDSPDSLASILRTKCTSVTHAKPLRSSFLEFLHKSLRPVISDIFSGKCFSFLLSFSSVRLHPSSGEDLKVGKLHLTYILRYFNFVKHYFLTRMWLI